MDFNSVLSAAASYLGGALNHDDVFIMDSQSYAQMFPFARPMRLTVIEPSKIMKHPLEDGSTITDHLVIEPIRIEISCIFVKGYKDTTAQFRSTFEQGKLLTIQTKAKAYDNMVLTDMPHEEDPDFMDILMATLKFEEARFVTPEYGELPASAVKNPKDASTVKRGTQQTTKASGADTAKASSSYQSSKPTQSGSTLQGWGKASGLT